MRITPTGRPVGLRSVLVFLLVTLLVTTPAAAQDVAFIRALERAQQARPTTLTANARIAPREEPGTPLVIHGRAYAADRKTPLAGAIVFAYHTDRGGVYDRPVTPAHSWRLRGWAQTGADGRFEFGTIRPGAYPGSKIAEHVHFTVFTAAGERFHGHDLNFADDKFVSATERDASAREGEFGDIQAVRMEQGVQHVEYRIWVEPGRRF